VEINLVLNAPNAKEPNILMDVPEKHPGITHVACSCDVLAAKAQLERRASSPSGGPMTFRAKARQAVFFRDPGRKRHRAAMKRMWYPSRRPSSTETPQSSSYGTP
jgi:lactoylglutathione lyase